MKHWTNTKLPEIVDKLEQTILDGFHVQSEEELNISGRKVISDILDDLLTILFPGVYGKERVTREELNFFLVDLLRQVSFKLTRQIRGVFEHHCNKDKCKNCNCEEKTTNACIHLVESLPKIRTVLMKDIAAAYAGDPASTSLEEIVLSYPFVEAIATYRIAHLLYEQDVPIIPRIMSERAHSRTGIDIHPGAKIGEGFFIDHGTGVVIGETCTIGQNVKIYQGVTLGALSPFDKEGNLKKGKKRHPDIEDDVIIYANAAILGGDTVIGKGAVIGGNTWITKSVPAGAVVYNTTKNAQKSRTVTK